MKILSTNQQTIFIFFRINSFNEIVTTTINNRFFCFRINQLFKFCLLRNKTISLIKFQTTSQNIDYNNYYFI